MGIKVLNLNIIIRNSFTLSNVVNMYNKIWNKLLCDDASWIATCKSNSWVKKKCTHRLRSTCVWYVHARSNVFTAENLQVRTEYFKYSHLIIICIKKILCTKKWGGHKPVVLPTTKKGDTPSPHKSKPPPPQSYACEYSKHFATLYW
jgi:hypothetical protein